MPNNYPYTFVALFLAGLSALAGCGVPSVGRQTAGNVRGSSRFPNAAERTRIQQAGYRANQSIPDDQESESATSSLGESGRAIVHADYAVGSDRQDPVALVSQESDPAGSDAPTGLPEEYAKASPILTGRSTEVLPIDLDSVIRLVNDNSPMIGFSRARVQEAQTRAAAAQVQWLPNLSVGTAYNRFDGRTQNQRGEVFSKSRSNLFANGGVTLSLDVSDAIYRPLIEQRLASAEQHRADATALSSELDAIIAYLDLCQVKGLTGINKQLLDEIEELLTAAKKAQDAKLDRTAGDVNRIQSELFLRRQERSDLEGRTGVASARLAKLLLLNPSVHLDPPTSDFVPITLVNTEFSLDDLVATALQNRPEIAASRDVVDAASERTRKAQRGPLLPKILVQDLGGVFGGGLNADIQDFGGRNALSGVVYWEVKNLGFGNRFDIQERMAGIDQAHFVAAETQAKVSSEVVEAAQVASAKQQALTVAGDAIKEATELYRINREGTFNLVDAKNLFDALRPLQALQVLTQARQNYLNAVLDYNRSQYRLFTALGCPQNISPTLQQ